MGSTHSTSPFFSRGRSRSTRTADISPEYLILPRPQTRDVGCDNNIYLETQNFMTTTATTDDCPPVFSPCESRPFVQTQHHEFSAVGIGITSSESSVQSPRCPNEIGIRPCTSELKFQMHHINGLNEPHSMHGPHQQFKMTCHRIPPHFKQPNKGPPPPREPPLEIIKHPQSNFEFQKTPSTVPLVHPPPAISSSYIRPANVNRPNPYKAPIPEVESTLPSQPSRNPNPYKPPVPTQPSKDRQLQPSKSTTPVTTRQPAKRGPYNPRLSILAPPVYISAGGSCGSSKSCGGLSGCRGPMDRLRNVDVVEELCYMVPGEPGPPQSYDYYKVNECGDLEFVSEGPTCPGESTTNPVTYTKRQRFNFKQNGSCGDDDGPPFAWPYGNSCKCNCCVGGRGRDPKCGCDCCAKGKARRAYFYDEIPVGKNPDVKRDDTSTTDDMFSATDLIQKGKCDGIVPSASGIYYFDAEKKRFFPQEEELVVEEPPVMAPPPMEPVIEYIDEIPPPIVQPVIMPSPCCGMGSCGPCGGMGNIGMNRNCCGMGMGMGGMGMNCCGMNCMGGMGMNGCGMNCFGNQNQCPMACPMPVMMMPGCQQPAPPPPPQMPYPFPFPPMKKKKKKKKKKVEFESDESDTETVIVETTTEVFENPPAYSHPSSPPPVQPAEDNYDDYQETIEMYQESTATVVGADGDVFTPTRNYSMSPPEAEVEEATSDTEIRVEVHENYNAPPPPSAARRKEIKDEDEDSLAGFGQDWADDKDDYEVDY